MKIVSFQGGFKRINEPFSQQNFAKALSIQKWYGTCSGFKWTRPISEHSKILDSGSLNPDEMDQKGKKGLRTVHLKHPLKGAIFKIKFIEPILDLFAHFLSHSVYLFLHLEKKYSKGFFRTFSHRKSGSDSRRFFIEGEQIRLGKKLKEAEDF